MRRQIMYLKGVEYNKKKERVKKFTTYYSSGNTVS